MGGSEGQSDMSLRSSSRSNRACESTVVRGRLENAGVDGDLARLPLEDDDGDDDGDGDGGSGMSCGSGFGGSFSLILVIFVGGASRTQGSPA